MADKKINNNGHVYVDLELPSGTLWATSNVGADKPTDFGLYFQWGDKVGYSSDQIGKEKGQKAFSSDWSDYGNGFPKYKLPGETLDLEDDAANNYMGGDWHVPSPEQFLELLYNTTYKYTSKNDVKGILFTSKKDASKTIFFPATGFVVNGDISGIGTHIALWTSKLSNEIVGSGQEFWFDAKHIGLYSSYVFAGHSLRAVIG